ncbi:DUF748 domain-containing protein [Xenophilus arseniciresistens]|uniref:DUF748 domain-containing protein n=1 Tax=Xenophilus arseniciresistens TaxID=1283306 RepID=A0AAE3N470_9BURK|nr:DUF748 domain-containing protein [Xenophilus arseniciresistens]MDA7415195.1 DUF748 domain-containing protein [Xenophilus arseniciresistens]
MNVAALIRHKWVRRGIVALGTLLGLWLLLWLAVPPIAKSQIQKIASAQLGRAVTLQRVDFKPWSLELALEGLQVAGPTPEAPPLLTVGRLYADAELQSLVRLAPVIDALRIESPVLRLARLDDGAYDIDDLLSRWTRPAEPPPEPTEPAGFAIYNIAVTGGAAHFNDQPVGREHVLRDLNLAVPFISSLKSQREVKVAPHLAFVLNDSPFDSSAFSTPFVDSRKTEARLDFSDFDLAPYLGYLPKSLPVQLRSGVLGARLKLEFEQAQPPVLRVQGEITASKVSARDAQGRELLDFETLRVALADLQPLARRVHLAEVALSQPRAVVARDAQGRLNVVPQGAPAEAAPAVPVTPPTAPTASTPAAAAPAPAAWQAQLDRFVLEGGQIGWRDAAVKAGATVDMKALQLEVQSVKWPMKEPARLKGGFEIDGAPFTLEGEGTDKAATLRAQVTGLPLSVAGAYLADTLAPALAGKLDARIEAQWAAPALKLLASQASIEGLALTQGKTALASVGRFELGDVAVDMQTRDVRIGRLSARSPKLRVERDSEQRWMYERWLVAPQGGAAVKTAAAPAAQPAAAPWKLRIDALSMDDGTVAYVDKAKAQPVDVEVSALKIQAGPIVPDSNTVTSLALSGRLASGRRAEPGRFDYKGKLTLKPLSTEGRLQTQAMPAHAFKAYYADALNVDIRRAYTSFRGNFALAMPPEGLRLKVAGDSAIEDFRANSASLTQAASMDARDEQLLRWKVLSLRGLKVDMAPAQPLKLDVNETTLTDFFARIILEESGRLNLQSLTKKGQEEGEAAAAQRPAAASRREAGGTTVTSNETPRPAARSTRSVSAEEQVGGDEPAPPAAATTAAAPAAASADSGGPAPVINFGPISVVNGRVDFTDLFIKPNYSADLSELTGRVSAFSSQPREGKPVMAELELRGKAQQTAALEISGRINPLAKPLELDITARMNELDLPPLSPYSVRYAGHGIERGKLSMNVNYKVAPDGRLTATNKLVLNQLRFGEEVKGAPNSLPVRLAVALLADRNGVIDVDLPLSGSLNDPQFSIGPLIWKAVLNLITKAVTAPFRLLTGGLGGGSSDSSTVPFAAGSAVLTEQAKKSLDGVVKALKERPELRMTVVGVSSFDKEKEAFRRERLREMALSEKRRAAVRSGQDARQIAPVTDAEYPALVEAVYKRAEITKPRNMVGLARDLPLKEMEALLLASIPVDAQAIRELAVGRGASVRDYLLEQGLPSQRLFLGNVRTDGSGADWQPGAQLQLDAS